MTYILLSNIYDVITDPIMWVMMATIAVRASTPSKKIIYITLGGVVIGILQGFACQASTNTIIDNALSKAVVCLLIALVIVGIMKLKKTKKQEVQ